VTIPRRTDTSTGENRRARLLAELPHVGEVTAVPQRHAFAEDATTSRTTQRIKSNHPAFAELDEFAEETVPASQRSRSLRYVDQAHVEQEWEQHEEFDDHETVSSRGRQTPQRSQIVQRHASHQHPRASGMGRLLSDAHEQLAPFAGLIVTAALIACAGLLILVMASGKQNGADLNEFALPGFRVEADGELSPVDAPLADSVFVPEAAEPDGMEYEPPRTEEPGSTPASAAPADASAAIPQPVIEQITEPTEPLGELSFPVTSTPLALDYNKAFDQTASALQELPAVAERDSAANSEPINR
jgi:hypothetical protein